MADTTRDFALAFVDELARSGVRHAVVAPGSRSTPIALALLEHPSVTVHVRVDERSASFLALGIAKASGCVVPVLCTSGTAAANFHPAVLEADQAGVPLLVLTADRPPELRGIGANQTIDQVGLYGRAVRAAVDLPVAEPGGENGWRAAVAEACSTALGPRSPGPVHLNLPLREPLVPTGPGVAPRAVEPGPPPRFGVIARDALELGHPRRGVVVLGDVGGRDVHPVTDLASRLGWPVIAEPHSGGRAAAPNALRVVDAVLGDAGFTARHVPDLVLVVGRVGLTRALVSWLARVRHVVISPSGRHLDVARSAEQVLGVDLPAVAELVSDPADPAWLADWQAASEAAAAAVDAVLDETDVLSEPRVARDVVDLLPDDAALVVSSSMPIRDLDLVMRPRNLTVYANRGVAGIDGFVSTAQGIAIAREGRPTYALLGDLSLLHDINGLLPSPTPRPDITYIVINNDGGGIFSLLEQGRLVEREAFEQLFGTAHGMDLTALATAYRCEHLSVRTADELAAALQWRHGVRLVEIRTDRTENAELHARLRAAAAAAVAALGAGNDDAQSTITPDPRTDERQHRG